MLAPTASPPLLRALGTSCQCSLHCQASPASLCQGPVALPPGGPGRVNGDLLRDGLVCVPGQPQVWEASY